MDDADLKKILQESSAKPADENAKKRALNLAMAEFDQQQAGKNQKTSKNFQGNGFFSRLIGITNKKDRRKVMKKRTYIFGGMATAMAVVLAVGVTLNQQAMQNIAIKSVPGTEEVAPEMQRGIAVFNIDQGNSALPVPITPPRGGQLVQGDAAKAKKPLQRWRKVQEGEQNVTAARAPTASKMQANESGLVMVDDAITPPQYKDEGRDDFEEFEQNQIKLVSEEPVSTFSVDVDTSSYSFMRRQIERGVLPQNDAVRIEELVNYFDYDYDVPETREQPFKGNVTVVDSPWFEGRKLMHIGIKGYDIEPAEKPRSNLVFLLDVSGSMNAQDKLPLLKSSMRLLLDTLDDDDTVAIAVYAGASGTVLEPTKVSEKSKIIQALENLQAGGGTAGAAGLKLAYQLAESNFDEEAVNRVILATDGDFNVGIRDHDELQDFIERKRDSGVFLSILGFGQGNLNDNLMQKLAQNGNGTAAYIDSLNEARKVLVEEASSTLFPIAKDVKIQVEFNPALVAEYRLIGYETRHLNREDFNNDAVDAGDIGAGHTVTAIYEITPVDGNRSVDESRYAKTDEAEEAAADTDFGSEYAFLKMRYKLPDEDTSKLITTPISMEDDIGTINDPVCGPDELCDLGKTDDVQFSAAVAAFGQLLKGGKYIGDFDYDDVIKLAQDGKGRDEFGYRAEFIQLVRLAKSAAAMK